MTVHSLAPETFGTDDDPLELDTHSPSGTYALVFDVPELTTEVGALGEQRFPAGSYVYLGSAFGTGGLRRVLRHRRVAEGDHDARHWHVDYLGGHPDVTLSRVVCVVDSDIECDVAAALADGPVDGFGSSDCDCTSHLARYETVDEALDASTAVFRQKG
ncbi:hypothetical protein C453_10955 [Haloferax elongans ATCC BAA-1513]|uniref:Endonuclease III n=1 Tax=Haloferax elongans ATCC BAA-1513 TaxID=1230453 RepID=M0HKL7_HALEO|nr:GIY-YIG nuclease family protein [Haloferax elongans]ELZ85095.1 hypothetical protein C453_10955 [Haloferax elongans ATCC BAA-1513]